MTVAKDRALELAKHLAGDWLELRLKAKELRAQGREAEAVYVTVAADVIHGAMLEIAEWDFDHE